MACMHFSFLIVCPFSLFIFLQKTLAVNEKELCKYFKLGNHVKVVSGAQEGATGMVVKVEGHVLIILSDTTKEDVSDQCFFTPKDKLMVVVVLLLS